MRQPWHYSGAFGGAAGLPHAGMHVLPLRLTRTGRAPEGRCNALDNTPVVVARMNEAVPLHGSPCNSVTKQCV